MHSQRNVYSTAENFFNLRNESRKECSEYGYSSYPQSVEYIHTTPLEQTLEKIEIPQSTLCHPYPEQGPNWRPLDTIREGYHQRKPGLYTKLATNNNSKEENKGYINMNYGTQKVSNTTDPNVWGPAFWFSIHNGAIHYPVKASPVARERMKGFIKGLSYILPCKVCSNHASSFIESNKSNLDDIVGGRDKLFNFFVDFHNHVNKNYGKEEMTYDHARKLYSQDAKVTFLKYN